jgi:hypothetical protein
MYPKNPVRLRPVHRASGHRQPECLEALVAAHRVPECVWTHRDAVDALFLHEDPASIGDLPIQTALLSVRHAGESPWTPPDDILPTAF